MGWADAELNRAALAVANAGGDYVSLHSEDPTSSGAGEIAAAGRAAINLGRAAGDPAGEVKNLAAVDFAPTGLVTGATHFAVHDAASGGNIRAWGRLKDKDGDDTTVAQASVADVLRIAIGGIKLKIE